MAQRIFFPFEQAVRVSDSMQEAARLGGRPLIPALSGCARCETATMIASPTLGVCEDCGAELTTVAGAEPRHPAAAPPALAA
jgi:hypothetical protein